MADDDILKRPGKPNLDDQFKAGAPIRKTRRLYDRIKDRTTEKYNFGELTSFFYKYDEDQDDSWQRDIRDNYPDDVVAQIRDHVITVLLKVDPRDQNPRISLTFEWDPHPPARAELTQTGYAHTITIHALHAPASTSFVDRPKTKY